MRIESSHQDVLGMATEYEGSLKKIVCLETKETYKAAIKNAEKFFKDKRRTDGVGTTLHPERTAQLATRRAILHNQVREILDFVEEDLEKVEVKQSQEALRTQRELLTKAEHKMQRAKQRT